MLSGVDLVCYTLCVTEKETILSVLVFIIKFQGGNLRLSVIFLHIKSSRKCTGMPCTPYHAHVCVGGGGGGASCFIFM